MQTNQETISRLRGIWERVAHGIFFTLGMLTMACVLTITIYLVLAGLPGITKIGVGEFLTGTTWAPTSAKPQFGILPFILTSIYGTCGALLLGVPLGILTALYLAKLAPPAVRRVLGSALDLLAAIPSVVYGLVGMLVLVPLIQRVFGLPDGSSLLAAIVVLTVMIVPSVVKVSLTSLQAVPTTYEEASLALGATATETYFRVSLPAAKNGVAAAIVLGVGRAIGEAMAVMMVAGNVANMPGLFQSVRFLTTAIASEMSYAAGLQRQALFSIGLVLFVFIMMINTAFALLLKKGKTA